MRLRAEVVDLIRLNLLEDVPQSGAVGEIARVQEHPRAGLVRIYIEVIDPIGIERRTPAEDSMNLIAFLEEKLRKIRAVLPGDSSDKCFLHFQTFHGAFPLSHSASK